jgi:hypothetical protein
VANFDPTSRLGKATTIAVTANPLIEKSNADEGD